MPVKKTQSVSPLLDRPKDESSSPIPPWDDPVQTPLTDLGGDPSAKGSPRKGASALRTNQDICDQKRAKDASSGPVHYEIPASVLGVMHALVPGTCQDVRSTSTPASASTVPGRSSAFIAPTFTGITTGKTASSASLQRNHEGPTSDEPVTDYDWLAKPAAPEKSLAPLAKREAVTAACSSAHRHRTRDGLVLRSLDVDGLSSDDDEGDEDDGDGEEERAGRSEVDELESEAHEVPNLNRSQSRSSVQHRAPAPGMSSALSITHVRL